MGSTWLSVVAMTAWLAACGCSLLPKPSDALRQESYARHRMLFTGSPDLAKQHTYVVFSGPPHFRATTRSTDGAVQWSGGEKGFASGMAVGCEPDGYLLTATHALGMTNYVWGRFDGRTGVRPARVIFKRNTRTHADFALIKVDARLEPCAALGAKPREGEPVFAVVAYRTGTGVAIGFAGGKVLSVEPDPVGGPLDLIRTDVPLWHGDSGGPLLSKDGRLVGINTGLSFTWTRYWAESIFSDQEFIRNLIANDRASRLPNNPARR